MSVQSNMPKWLTSCGQMTLSYQIPLLTPFPTKMFPNSSVAKNFSSEKTKCSYVVCFCLAPYFKALLTKSVSNVKHVALFDESFNKISKRGQMDMHVRYRDNTQNYLAKRYYQSELVGKASAKNVLNPLVHAYQVLAKASCSRFLLMAQT